MDIKGKMLHLMLFVFSIYHLEIQEIFGNFKISDCNTWQELVPAVSKKIGIFWKLRKRIRKLACKIKFYAILFILAMNIFNIMLLFQINQKTLVRCTCMSSSL